MKPHVFSYFIPIHIYSLLMVFIIGMLILILPKIIKNISIRQYSYVLGILLILTKTIETIQRWKFEHFDIPELVPLHFCNFALIIAILYLFTQKNDFFNILYFFSFGAILALLLPGINTYYQPMFVYLFILNHGLEVIIVLYGFIYLNEQITFRGYIISSITSTILFFVAFIYNKIFDKNFMFLKIYLIPFLKFIKPFWLYQILLICSFPIIMFLLYIPFRKKNEHK